MKTHISPTAAIGAPKLSGYVPGVSQARNPSFRIFDIFRPTHREPENPWLDHYGRPQEEFLSVGVKRGKSEKGVIFRVESVAIVTENIRPPKLPLCQRAIFHHHFLDLWSRSNNILAGSLWEVGSKCGRSGKGVVCRAENIAIVTENTRPSTLPWGQRAIFSLHIPGRRKIFEASVGLNFWLDHYGRSMRGLQSDYDHSWTHEDF
jgi:hypothetical protein